MVVHVTDELRAIFDKGMEETLQFLDQEIKFNSELGIEEVDFMEYRDLMFRRLKKLVINLSKIDPSFLDKTIQ